MAYLNLGARPRERPRRPSREDRAERAEASGAAEQRRGGGAGSPSPDWDWDAKFRCAILRVNKPRTPGDHMASIDSSVPAPGHTGSKIRLPLQYFDNIDMERNTPQGWVEQCRKQRAKRGIQPTAIVLLTDESGVGQWRLGRVFHWDEKTSTYHVHLANALGQIVEDSSVALPRLSVCFLAEPMHEFAQRVAAAHRARDETEAKLLFRFYVTNMPTGDMRSKSTRLNSSH